MFTNRPQRNPTKIEHNDPKIRQKEVQSHQKLQER